MNLHDLLLAAAGGHASLAAQQVTADQAARLWTHVSDDRSRMSLYQLPEPADMRVELEEVDADDEGAVIAVRVGGVLRYQIDTTESTNAEAVTRLCEQAGCSWAPCGDGVSTAVCEQHLDRLMPGLLSPDDFGSEGVRPGAEDHARRESWNLRLDAWDDELRQKAQQIEHRRYFICRTRESAAA
ncbi:hypothetical protein [Streptomyces sp. NPDC049879]|uniref:hypothetical protein n=1 Tax=Streptomyces sp. NPDC049879 TaxID=3365598 RepID=UPI0037BB6E3B